MTRYRVRKGLFGKRILQRWSCFPLGIPSALAGTCDWIDVDYNKAPSSLSRSEECVQTQYGDTTICSCGNKWDTNDYNPPKCKGITINLEGAISAAIEGIYIENDYGSSPLRELKSDKEPAVKEIVKEILKIFKEQHYEHE